MKKNEFRVIKAKVYEANHEGVMGAANALKTEGEDLGVLLGECVQWGIRVLSGLRALARVGWHLDNEERCSREDLAALVQWRNYLEEQYAAAEIILERAYRSRPVEKKTAAV